MFKTPGLTQLLADEIVKNLVFLGRCAGVKDLKWSKSQDVESDEDEEEDGEKEKRTTLQYLFGRLSFILRRETSPPRAPALIPKTSALQLLDLLASKLSPDTLIPSLQTLLLPLSNLTDPSIPIPYSTDDLFKSGYEELKSKSEEIMAYTEALLKVREGVKERRVKRSAKRKVEAVSAPERFGEGKRKKVERKKERKKERGAEHAKRRSEY
jgi:U3 small nucleolar RNA-associated protein 20